MPQLTISRRPIQILPRQLANQIAAGEVVERPASVVKELLENSIDAGADTITIDIEQGGTGLIRVTDNGCGIPRDELKLAVSRHATSKLESLQELEQIRSMGFRGEALASIASVSDMRITSRSQDDDMAWCLHCDADKEDISPDSLPAGTRVEVARLFHNTPARRHFLKSERTELRHIEDVVQRLALAHFDLAITFRHNQRNILQLAACHSEAARSQRLARLLGKGFLKQSVRLDFSSDGLRLWGWAGLADFSRSQADMQYVFINQRMVRDRLINHALRQAYGESLHPGRFPVYVLFIELDPTRVDVNVHPTKHEVRFRDARLVHDFLQLTLQRALNEVQHMGLAEVETQVDNRVEEAASVSTSSWSTAKPAAQPVASWQQPLQDSHTSLGQYLGWLNKRYLLVENQQGLMLVHVARARQRWLEKRFLESLQLGQVTRQPILVPLSFAASGEQMRLVEQQQDLLRTIGFELAAMGETQLVVRQVPALLREMDLQRVVALLLEVLVKHQGQLDATVVIQAVLAASDSHAAETGAEATRSLLERFASLEQTDDWCRIVSWQDIEAGFDS